MKKFVDAWEMAQALTVIIGALFAYKRMDGGYILSAMGTLLLLMGLEAIVKKEISLRGQITKKSENSRKFNSAVATYIICAVITYLLTIFCFTGVF